MGDPRPFARRDVIEIDAPASAHQQSAVWDIPRPKHMTLATQIKGKKASPTPAINIAGLPIPLTDLAMACIAELARTEETVVRRRIKTGDIN